MTTQETPSKGLIPSPDELGPALGVLLIRIWLGMRAIVSGIEKFGGTKASDTPVEIDGAANTYGLTEATAEKTYSLSNYHGVPESMAEKFTHEPLIPNFMLGVYNGVLGPALIILGFTVLLGILPNLSLFAMGLLYTSLTFGLVLLHQDSGIAWLAVHIVLVAMGLVFAKHNRWSILNKW